MRSTVVIAAILAITSVLIADDAPPPPVNAGTDSAVELRAPPPRDGFDFVVFGDRTDGKPEGVRVLDRAVAMANRLDPDFVMTVGDLVQGYCGPDAWLKQVTEYKAAMGRLAAPWYPVVGDHDVYGGKANPAGNVALFKANLGPLWYSFDHKWAHVVCLFSDEALSFADPAKDQDVSPKQLEWLRKDLAATKAEQVFVFLHHPRWLYDGCNWPEVHKVLVADGRTRAVVCGHLHTYRDDGVRDGVHYYVLAMTGAESGSPLAETAAVQHIAHVKVRRDRFTMALLPIDRDRATVQASDAVLGTEVDVMNDLAGGDWLGVEGAPQIGFGAGRSSLFQIVVRNPTDRLVPWEARISADEGWTVETAALKGVAAPLATVKIPVKSVAPAYGGKRAEIRVEATIVVPLTSGLTQAIRTSMDVPVRLSVPAGTSAPRRTANKVLVLDGSSAVRVPLPREETAFAQFTLECWAKSRAPTTSTMHVVSKTERSSFGIAWCEKDRQRGAPTGMLYASKMTGTKKAGWIRADAREPVPIDTWTHLALVFDGTKLRFYVGGKLVDEQEAASPVTTNALPFYVGADPGGGGRPADLFTGSIDEVRLSRVARYGAAFTPPKVFDTDGDTVLLLHFDTDEGGVHLDDSGRENHGWPVGTPRLENAGR